MEIAPLPKNEEARLQKLEGFQILDTFAEVEFDDLARLASIIFNTPMSAVSLVDRYRAWFKAKIGIDVPEVSRDESFCSHVVYHGNLLVINDTLEDKRFFDHPLAVSCNKIRFYASAPLTTSDGYVLGSVCVADTQPREITEAQLQALNLLSRQVVNQIESRTTNQKLEESEEKYRVIGEAANEGIVMVNEHGRIIYANPALSRIFGFTQEELVNESVTLLMPERMRTLHEVGFMRFIATGRKELDWDAVELVGLKKDQSEIELEASFGEFYGYGKSKKIIIGIIRDVTESKKEKALLEMSNRVLLAMAEGVDVLDEEGKIIFCNPANEKMFGYASGEMLQRSSMDMDAYSPEENLKNREKIRSLLEQDGIWQGDVLKLKKDGTPFIVQKHITLLKTDGKIFWVQVKEDITEKRKTLNLIEEQRVRAISTARLAALGEMSAGIAHEINNPLAIINGLASITKDRVLSGPMDSSVVAKAMDKIEATVMRITRIIKALKSFAREGEGDPYKVTPIQEILEDSLEFCKTRFKNNGIDLEIVLFPESLTIECRSVQISQVLLNLLNNAFDAVHEYEQKWVKIEVKEENNWIQISIVDSGTGIPESMRDKILQPFFTTKEPGKGTGLGLSISKGIIESHGGTLTIDTQNPHTSFVMRLPKVQNLICLK